MRQTGGQTLVGARNTTMDLVAGAIYDYASRDNEVDKPVVDRTGLQGRFDFSLDLPYPVFTFPPGPLNPDAASQDPQGARFLKAVRDQLGLRLVPAKAAIRTLVIDHVERPTDN